MSGRNISPGSSSNHCSYDIKAQIVFDLNNYHLIVYWLVYWFICILITADEREVKDEDFLTSWWKGYSSISDSTSMVSRLTGCTPLCPHASLPPALAIKRILHGISPARNWSGSKKRWLKNEWNASYKLLSTLLATNSFYTIYVSARIPIPHTKYLKRLRYQTWNRNKLQEISRNTE